MLLLLSQLCSLAFFWCLPIQITFIFELSTLLNLIERLSCSAVHVEKYLISFYCSLIASLFPSFECVLLGTGIQLTIMIPPNSQSFSLYTGSTMPDFIVSLSVGFTFILFATTVRNAIHSVLAHALFCIRQDSAEIIYIY